MADYKKRPVRAGSLKKRPKKPDENTALNRSAISPMMLKGSNKSVNSLADLDKIDLIPMKDSKLIREQKTARSRSAAKPPVKRMASQRRTNATDKRNSSFKVVKGKKGRARNRTFISAGIAAALILALVIINFNAPVGIIELFQNSYASAGSGGGFPFTPAGGKSALVYPREDNMLILSDTLVEAYNKNGKEIYRRQHGFSNPVLMSSESRTLVYDRAGTGAKVYNMNKILFEKKLENNILSADIGRDGTCAFVTKARGYAAQIIVVDRDFLNKFNWWSAEEMIGSLAVSNDGKHVAAAAISAVNGEYLSKLYIFDISKSDPVSIVEFSGTMLLEVHSSGNGLLLLFGDRIVSVSWNGNDKVEYPFTGSLKSSAFYEDHALLSVEDDGGAVHKIAVFDSKAKVLCSFDFKGNLRDATISRENIYCLTENKLSAFTFDGSALDVWDCGYQVESITGYLDSVLALGVSGLERYTPGVGK